MEDLIPSSTAEDLVIKRADSVGVTGRGVSRGDVTGGLATIVELAIGCGNFSADFIFLSF